MPLPLLGPIIAALGEAAAGMGGEAVAGMAARGAASAAASGGGFALEDTGLTNAKSITAALRGSISNIFSAPTGAAKTAAAGQAADSHSAWQKLFSASGPQSATSPGAGGAAKLNAGNWGPASPFDAIKYGSPTGGGGGGGNSHDKFAAGDWGQPDPGGKKAKSIDDMLGNEADRIGGLAGNLQVAEKWGMRAAQAALPIIGGGIGAGMRNALGRAADNILDASGLSGLRGTNEIGEGSEQIKSHLTNPLKWLDPTDLADGVMKVAKGFAHLPFDIEATSLALLASQKRLAQFSGAIAGNVMSLDRQQFELDYRMASRTAGTNTLATASTMALSETLQPFKELNENLKNLRTTLLTMITTSLIQAVDNMTGLSRTVQKANDLLEVLSGERAIRNATTRAFTDAIGRGVEKMPWQQPVTKRP